jgi:hypothetical protein
VHEVVPREALGKLFSRRLFWSTVLSSVGALSAGYLVQAWPPDNRLRPTPLRSSPPARQGL